MKSGKYCLGYKQTLKTLRQGKAKLIIIANNTPHLRWDDYWEVEFPLLLRNIFGGTIWSHFDDWEVCVPNGKRYGVILALSFAQMSPEWFQKASPSARDANETTFESSVENLRSSTTLCWPRLVSITTTATTLSSEQPAVNTSACARSPSLMLVTPTSSALCQKPRPATTKCDVVNFVNLWNKVSEIKNFWHWFLFRFLLCKLNSITAVKWRIIKNTSRVGQVSSCFYPESF